MRFLDTMLAPGQPFDNRFGLLWWRLIGEVRNAVAYNADYDPEMDGFSGFKTLVMEIVPQ